MASAAVITAALALLGCGACPDLGHQLDTRASYKGMEMAKWLQQGVCNLIALKPLDPILVQEAVRALQGQNVPPRPEGGIGDVNGGGFGVPRKEK